MNRYTTYQCTVCRRVKSVEQDNRHAISSGCTITKGCAGNLFKIGDAAAASPAAPVLGVTDWYPRGVERITQPQVSEETLVEMSIAANGALAVAIKMSDSQAAARQLLTLKLFQRRVEAVPFNQFVFTVLNDTSVITGRDSRGKNLRIDATAYEEGRVRIKINGVERPADSYSISPSALSTSIIFSETVLRDSSVDVVVFTEKEVDEKFLDFTSNSSVAASSLNGAWGNVKWVDRISTNGEVRYWIYTCTSVASLTPAARVQLLGMYDANSILIPAEDVLFLMSSAPHSHIDRYTNFVVEMQSCIDTFNIMTDSSTTRDFMIGESNVKSVYPPLQIKRGYTALDNSLSSSDVIPEPSSAVQTDTSVVLLSNKFVNGPV